MNHDGPLRVQPLDLPYANCLDKLMKTLKAGLILVVALVGMNASSVKADQPRMQAALRALRTARAELQAASHDKGGHRMRALEHVNQAIAEVERGMEFDPNT